MLSDFYKSKEWEKFRKIIIAERINENGETIDEITGLPITRKYDIILHHKVALTEENYSDAAVSLNPDNIMIVSHKTHNKLHHKLSLTNRQVYLVYGAPLSGKSSYVKSVADIDDLIVDMDSIWKSICIADRYVKPNKLKQVAFAIRNTMLDCVKYRRGKWSNAYVIGGYPYKGERDRLASELGAREIFINEGRDICLERLKNQNERPIDEWEKYINEWFENFSE